MPSRKRSSSDYNNLRHDDQDDSSPQQLYRRRQQTHRQEEEEEEEEEHQDHLEHLEEEEDDSDHSGSDPEDLTEFVSAFLSDDVNARRNFKQFLDVRKIMQCPICLGIRKKTRTVMDCMHRFCRECIDKSMRLGNNECPACRTHCPSRRSLRDDTNYDTLIGCLYPDIEKYEEEELRFHEDESIRNRQIQESIAQISHLQSEALVKKRKMGKDIADGSTSRLPRNSHLYYSSRLNSRSLEIQESDYDDDDEDAQDGNKSSSSSDDWGAEVKHMRSKKHTGRTAARLSQHSPAANSGAGCIEYERESSREKRGSPGFVCNPETLTWGRGGTRSNTRHGSAVGSKGTRSTRISKLVDYLQGLQENDDELDVHPIFPLDNQSTPSLQHPYICCQPSLSVRHICEYVEHETPLRANNVEMLLVKDTPNTSPLTSTGHKISKCQHRDGLQNLEGQENVAGLIANYTSSNYHLGFAYRQKGTH